MKDNSNTKNSSDAGFGEKPEKNESQSDRTLALNQELINSITKTGSAEGQTTRNPLDIMKDLLLDEDKNKPKLRTENLSESEGNSSDLMMKIMFGIAGLALIAGSGGAAIPVLAGGVAMVPILPEILKKGREFLLGKDKEDGKDDDQQIGSKDFLQKELPKKMLALSLFEFANSGKTAIADFIFKKEDPLEEINPLKNIKDYTDSLSKMSPELRTAELNSLKEEVTKMALASIQPNLSEKIDKVFLGLNEVLEGKNLEKKEGERDILGELKNNLSVKGIINSDVSVTTAVSETSKKEGKEGKEGKEVPSPAPASRGVESAPRANLIEGAEALASAGR